MAVVALVSGATVGPMDWAVADSSGTGGNVVVACGVVAFANAGSSRGKSAAAAADASAGRRPSAAAGATAARGASCVRSAGATPGVDSKSSMDELLVQACGAVLWEFSMSFRGL